MNCSFSKNLSIINWFTAFMVYWALYCSMCYSGQNRSHFLSADFSQILLVLTNCWVRVALQGTDRSELISVFCLTAESHWPWKREPWQHQGSSWICKFLQLFEVVKLLLRLCRQRCMLMWLSDTSSFLAPVRRGVTQVWFFWGWSANSKHHWYQCFLV